MIDPTLRPQQVIDRLIADAKPLPELAGLTRAGLLQWPVSLQHSTGVENLL